MPTHPFFLKQDETVLVRRMAHGEVEAFSDFFGKYQKLVLSIAVRVLHNVADAEDLAQEVFLELWWVAKTYDPTRASVKSWVALYAYHRALNRKNYLSRRCFALDQTPDAVAFSDPCAQLWKGLPMGDWKQMIARVLPKLTPEQQRSLEAVYLEGKTLSEVARDSEDSLSNVKNHVYRDLKRLRRLLRVNGAERFIGKRTEKAEVH